MTVVEECTGKPNQVPVTATLWGSSDPVVGFHTPTETLVTTLTTYTTGASGCWQLDLPPNSEIEPPNTVWRIERNDTCADGRTDYISFLSVPATGGPYQAWDLQVPPPGPFPLWIGNLVVGDTLIVNGVNMTPTELSSLPDPSTPLDGTELVAMEQSGVAVKATSELLAGHFADSTWGVNRNRQKYASDFDDFLTGITANGTLVGGSRMQAALSGAGSQITQGANVGETGIADLATGTATNGRAGLQANFPSLFFFNAGATYDVSCRMKMPVVSDGTNTYQVIMGIGDMTTLAVGYGFIFRSPTGAGNWSAVVREDNADADVADTGVAVDSNGAFHIFRVRYDPVFGARFWIDGVLKAQETTVLPDALDNLANIGVAILKTAGGTSRILEVDAFSANIPGARPLVGLI